MIVLEPNLALLRTLVWCTQGKGWGGWQLNVHVAASWLVAGWLVANWLVGWLVAVMTLFFSQSTFCENHLRIAVTCPFSPFRKTMGTV
jgi:hypothetical protein